MKAFAGALAVLVLLLAGAGFYSHKLNESVDALSETLTALENRIREGDWEGSSDLMKTLTEDWKEAEKWMKMFIDHRQMDVINQTVYETEGYISCRNHDDSAAKTVVLQKLLRHIPATEALRLENIF